MTVAGQEIVARFSRTYRFPLSACDTLDNAVLEARRFALLLLDEERANYSGLPARFLELVAAVRGWQIDSAETYLPHSVVVLSRISEARSQRTDNQCRVELASEDEHFFLELSREANDQEVLGPVHVEWPKIGYGIRKERQYGDASGLEIERTRRFLVLSFPPNTKWRTTFESPGDNASCYRGTRLALEVQWDAEVERGAVESIARLMKGLDFTNRR